MPDGEPHQPILPDGMDVPAQVLEQHRLGTTHEWSLLPASGLDFRDNVEMVWNPRPDIERYKLIAESNRTIARNLFSILARSNTLFKIPDTISCSRTYARDAEEAYYVDAMDTYLNAPLTNLDIRDLPILKGRLRSRMFCAFRRKPGYRYELFERRRVKRWIPYDPPENRHCDDTALASRYPRTEPWVNEIYQPPALAVPLQFSVYYYHQELRDAQVYPQLANTNRVVKLRFSAKGECYILFMAVWWNDLYFGGQMYVLENSTIDILEAECGMIENIADMPAQAIIAHMRLASGFPRFHHNWMTFSDDCMESSTFIWAIKKTGCLDSRRAAGLRLFCSKEQRKISTYKYGNPIYSRGSVMEERVSVPDLDKIEGLMGLVEERDWQAHGSLRVVDLVHNLFSLYRRTCSELGDLRRDLTRAEDEVWRKNRDFQDMRMDLDGVRGDLRDATGRVRHRDEHMKYLDSLLREKEKRVDELRECIDKQGREIHELRSKVALRSVQSAVSPGLNLNDGLNNTLEDDVDRSPQYNPLDNAGHAQLHGEPSSALYCNPQDQQNCERPMDQTATKHAAQSTISAPTSAPTTPGNPNSSNRNRSENDVTETVLPAQAAGNRGLQRPKRGYPFYEIPLAVRKRMNCDVRVSGSESGKDERGW